MADKNTGSNSLVGRWRITWMQNWNMDYVDAETEGYLSFDANGAGEFQFGYVHGFVDYQKSIENNNAIYHFTWDGNDEMDHVFGKGWARAQENTLEGEIFFHQSDHSNFRARKKTRSMPKIRKKL